MISAMSERAAGTAHLVVASNRGPLSFTESDGGVLQASRGGGGLVSGLSSMGDGDIDGIVWVCAALTDDDRAAARQAPGGRLDQHGHDTGGTAVRMLDIDPATFHRAYNAIANSTLWFVHHLLYATPTAPAFDAGFRREWASYLAYNQAFADAVAEEAAPGSKVLVQDYHLTLVPRLLRDQRPDLRIGHFSHTPWAPVDYFRLLPADVARETLLGMLGADHTGFHSPRWARAFAACGAEVLGAETEGGTSVTYDGHTTVLGVHALGVDGEALRERAHEDDVETRLTALRQKLEDRRAIVRVDRTELSKNIGRGLLAYRELLRRYPEWKGKVTHLASAYPSRHDLPEYREYTAAVQRLATDIEDEFGTDDWRPIVLDVTDDYARSLALYRVGDVLLVNPVPDGMKLVAKEMPLV
jgi:trehalose 6-phosphate synthase